MENLNNQNTTINQEVKIVSAPATAPVSAPKQPIDESAPISTKKKMSVSVILVFACGLISVVLAFFMRSILFAAAQYLFGEFTTSCMSNFLSCASVADSVVEGILQKVLLIPIIISIIQVAVIVFAIILLVKTKSAKNRAGMTLSIIAIVLNSGAVLYNVFIVFTTYSLSASLL